jgi:hypothetical protein
MTADIFNEKYKDFLEEGHYGAEGFDNPIFLDWLDAKFQKFITYPNFTYSQIKCKFNYGRFYCEGVPIEEIKEVEQKIEEFLKVK